MSLTQVVIGIALAILVLKVFDALRTRTVSARDVFVIDGDTIGVRRRFFRPERIRIANIDAPETRGLRSLWEGRRGEDAKKALKDLIWYAETIEIVSSGGRDRFGRTLARVRAISDQGRVDAGEHLVRRGLARRWA
ncbi:thermonuclease family protein [Microvirga massiliensis]|uniref:thermonuclease family protein n=1 Tax=Microvirga massiliensis TaxID=1033741 RepID=UPI00066134E4|nr:thermonuclease family protein [Microvirga massiliensis]